MPLKASIRLFMLLHLQVPAAEYNPMEFINTNVLGAENVVQACFDSSVKRVVFKY